MNNQVGYTQQRKIIDFWRLNNDESINKKRNSYNVNNKALYVFEAFLFNVISRISVCKYEHSWNTSKTTNIIDIIT
jgi:hypothetical protein